MIEFKLCFCIILDYTYLINIVWIRIRMDPELMPGSRSGTGKIQSWIRIRNKSFQIHNTCFELPDISTAQPTCTVYSISKYAEHYTL